MTIKDEFKKLKHDLYTGSEMNPSKLLQLIEKVFKEDKGGYFQYRIKDGQLMVINGKEEILVSNTIVIPVCEIVVKGLDGDKKFLQVIGLRNGREVLEAVILDQVKLNSAKWMRNEWGYKTRIFLVDSAYSYVRDALDNAIEYIPVAIRYSYIGWAQDKPGIYLNYNDPIGDIGNIDISVDDSLRGMQIKRSNFIEKKSFRFVVDTMLNIASVHITYTALSFTFLSLLSSVLAKRQRRPEFMYYLYGPSGSRKSSLAKLFFNIFERYAEVMPTNFLASKAAMEDVATVIRDAVTVYDDFAPSVTPSEHHGKLEKLETLVRTYGDTVGRQKMMDCKTRVEQNPLGLGAVTAESNMLSGESSIGRCLLVKIDKDDVDLTLLTHAQNKRIVFMTAICHYIAFIAADFENYIAKFETEFWHNRREFEVACRDAHPRLVMNAAWLKTSFDAYLDYGYKVKGIKRERGSILKQQNATMLRELLSDQAQMIKHDEPVVLFINALSELLASKKALIAPIHKSGKRNVTIMSTGFSQLIGYQDEKYLYLLRETSYNLVQQFYARQGKSFPATVKSLVEALYQKGFLRPDGNQDRTKSVRVTIGGYRTNVLRVDRRILTEAPNSESAIAYNQEVCFLNGTEG